MSKKGRRYQHHCSQCGHRFGRRDTFCVECGGPLRLDADEPVLEEKGSPDVDPIPENLADGHTKAVPEVGSKESATAEDSTIEFQLESPQPLVEDSPILAERHYIGPRYNHYMKKFELMRAKKRAISWNWPAFLAPPFWMIFRKLYLPGFLLLLPLLAAFLIDRRLLFPVYLLEGLFSGLFGDEMVRRRLCRLIEAGRTLVEPYRSRHIRKKGGVQIALTVVVLSLSIILFSLYSSFLHHFQTRLADEPEIFCHQEECDEKAVPEGQFCYDHTCLEAGCTQKRDAGSQYCPDHHWMTNVCAEAGCQEETLEDGMYCFEHTCMYEGCVARRSSESEFCHTHTPDPTSSFPE